jgi:regulator of replication initiation timing
MTAKVEIRQLEDQVALYSEELTSLQMHVARLEVALNESRNESAVLRSERRQLRRRLVECRPWVGVSPADPAKRDKVDAIRDLVNDTLREVVK